MSSSAINVDVNGKSREECLSRISDHLKSIEALVNNLSERSIAEKVENAEIRAAIFDLHLLITSSIDDASTDDEFEQRPPLLAPFIPTEILPIPRYVKCASFELEE